MPSRIVERFEVDGLDQRSGGTRRSIASNPIAKANPLLPSQHPGPLPILAAQMKIYLDAISCQTGGRVLALGERERVEIRILPTFRPRPHARVRHQDPVVAGNGLSQIGNGCQTLWVDGGEREGRPPDVQFQHARSRKSTPPSFAQTRTKAGLGIG